MPFSGRTSFARQGGGRRGFLVVAQSAPKKPASTPLRMAPVALAVEGPGSGAFPKKKREKDAVGFPSPEGRT